MPRWKELPGSLDERVRQLIVQLRRLKDRSELSFASLASKTGYSSTSWERYLNGKALPPRQAVEALARVAGTEPTRLLVLHEVAEQAWQGRATEAPSTDVPPRGERGDQPADRGATAQGPGADRDPAGSKGRVGRWAMAPSASGSARPPGVRVPVVVAAVAVALLVGLGAGMLVAAPADRADDRAGGTHTPTGSTHPSATALADGPGHYVYKMGKDYPCSVRRTQEMHGGLSAHYSTTRTAMLAGPGWDVVEAQCLLRYHGMDPGIVDGVYGQQTIAAVARLQKKAGLVADGIVGPDTWRVLRK